MMNVDMHGERPKVLARYLKKNRVDQFFGTGQLMLTTYARCKRHEDERRRDGNEGKAGFYFDGAGRAMAGITHAGANSFMLCCSLSESEQVMRRFGADDYIRIEDIDGFLEAVSKCIPGLMRIQAGRCEYRDERQVVGADTQPVLVGEQALFDAAMGDDHQDIEALFYEAVRQRGQHIEHLLGHAPYFLKDIEFAPEEEYRIVWTLDHEVTDPLHVHCPEAVRCCSRVIV
jgi:hypothetical protein